MRDACTDLGSLAGICVNPLYGSEARSMPQNSYSLGMSASQPSAVRTIVLPYPADVFPSMEYRPLDRAFSQQEDRPGNDTGGRAERRASLPRENHVGHKTRCKGLHPRQCSSVFLLGRVGRTIRPRHLLINHHLPGRRIRKRESLRRSEATRTRGQTPGHLPGSDLFPRYGQRRTSRHLRLQVWPAGQRCRTEGTAYMDHRERVEDGWTIGFRVCSSRPLYYDAHIY